MGSRGAAEPSFRPLIWRRNWRAWPDNLVHLWRRSLRFRTLSVTIVLTAFAILIAVTWTALAIQDDLFASRRDEVTEQALRATASAQTRRGTRHRSSACGSGCALHCSSNRRPT